MVLLSRTDDHPSCLPPESRHARPPRPTVAGGPDVLSRPCAANSVPRLCPARRSTHVSRADWNTRATRQNPDAAPDMVRRPICPRRSLGPQWQDTGRVGLRLAAEVTVRHPRAHCPFHENSELSAAPNPAQQASPCSRIQQHGAGPCFRSAASICPGAGRAQLGAATATQRPAPFADSRLAAEPRCTRFPRFAGLSDAESRDVLPKFCGSPDRSGNRRRRLPCIHQIALLRVGALDDSWADDGTRPADGDEQDDGGHAGRVPDSHLRGCSAFSSPSSPSGRLRTAPSAARAGGRVARPYRR